VVGGHCQSFENTSLKIFEITGTGAELKSINNSSVLGYNFNKTAQYKVVFMGKYVKRNDDSNPYLFIQPNRGITTATYCFITNIQLTRYESNTRKTERTYKIQAEFGGKLRLSPRVFNTTPKPPYSKGDQWIKSTADDNGDVSVETKYCSVSRDTGEYVAGDWGSDEVEPDSTVESSFTALDDAKTIIASFPPNSIVASATHTLNIVDTTAGKVKDLLVQYG
jgi:hypothetical protein